MAKTANLYARIEPELKQKAEEILSDIGIPASSAITMFYKQIILHKGMPFEVKLPISQNTDSSCKSEKQFYVESERRSDKLSNGRERCQVGILSEKQGDYSDKTDTARKVMQKLLNEVPEKQLSEIINYLTYLKIRNESNLYKELLTASESSLDFWFNDIDDEEWNNV